MCNATAAATDNACNADNTKDTANAGNGYKPQTGTSILVTTKEFIGTTLFGGSNSWSKFETITSIFLNIIKTLHTI